MRNIFSVFKRDGFIVLFKKILFKFLCLVKINSFLTIKRDDFLIKLFNTDLTYQLFANKKYKTQENKFYESLLKENSVAIDVGANIGTISLTIAKHTPNGRVLSFEPSSLFFKILQENIKINPQGNIIKAYNYALGNGEGFIGFNEEKEDDTTFTVDPLSKNKVPLARLDSFTKEHQKIDLLKIDVEGYEEDVLLGALETLSKTETIIIEFITENFTKNNKNQTKVIEILEKYFNLFTTEDGASLVPFSYKKQTNYMIDIIGKNKK